MEEYFEKTECPYCGSGNADVVHSPDETKGEGACFDCGKNWAE